jgi:AsmA family protein
MLPAEALSLDALNVANLDIRIRARRILTSRLTVNDLASDFVPQDGDLRVNVFNARLDGGTLDGCVSMRSKGGAVGVETVLKANRLGLDLVARELGFNENPGGELDLDMDVKGNGRSVADIMASLNGKVFLTVTNSRIRNNYINHVVSNIGSTAFKLANPFKRDLNYAEINCFVLGFDVTNGMARSKALSFDTNLMSGAGHGSINLKTESLDFSFSTSAKSSARVSGLGKVGLSLGEFAEPFKLTGTLLNPALILDLGQTTLAVGRALGSVPYLAQEESPVALPPHLKGRMRGEKACLVALNPLKRRTDATELTPRH